MPKYYITLQQQKSNRKTYGRKAPKRKTLKFPPPSYHFEGLTSDDLMPRFYERPSNQMYGGSDDAMIYPDSWTSWMPSLSSSTSSTPSFDSPFSPNPETYIIKYTKLGDGSVTNKEVFIQNLDTYEHYLIDESNRVNNCWKPIPFLEFGNYINSEFNKNNEFSRCGVELTRIGTSI